jgi:hypothetical protein
VNSQKAGFESGLSYLKSKENLNQRIRQAERQLDKASIGSETSTNTQTDRVIPLTTMSERRMVAPGSRDAPSFRSSRPEGLVRFICRMEDLWTESGVTDDKVKKSMIGRYADQDTKEEVVAVGEQT